MSYTRNTRRNERVDKPTLTKSLSIFTCPKASTDSKRVQTVQAAGYRTTHKATESRGEEQKIDL
jgi:hypothetical protein